MTHCCLVPGRREPKGAKGPSNHEYQPTMYSTAGLTNFGTAYWERFAGERRPFAGILHRLWKDGG